MTASSQGKSCSVIASSVASLNPPRHQTFCAEADLLDSVASVFPSPAPSGQSTPNISTPVLAQSANHPTQPPVGSLSHSQSPAFRSLSSVQRAGDAPVPARNATDGNIDPTQPRAALDPSSSSFATLPASQGPGQPTATSMPTERATTQADSALEGAMLQGGGRGAEPYVRPAKRRRSEHAQLGSVVAPISPQQSLFSHHALRVIGQQLDSFGGLASLDPTREKPRYNLLWDACTRDDLLYVMLHQLYCLWSVNSELSYAWLGQEIEPGVVDSAFNILVEMLKRNSDLPAAHLNWFASFPLSFKTVASSIPRRRLFEVVSQIKSFLQHFATGWAAVLASVDERRFPLLVFELQSVLQCPSPALQWVLFTASRRRLGVQDEVAHELYRLFTMDGNSECGQGNDIAETVQMRTMIADKYRVIVAQARGKSSPHLLCVGGSLLINSALAPRQGPMHLSQSFAHSLQNNGSATHPAARAQPTARPSASFASPSPHAFAPPAQATFGNGSGHSHAYDGRSFLPYDADARVVANMNQGNGQARAPRAPSGPIPAHMFAATQPVSPNATSPGQPATAFSAPVPAVQGSSQAAPHPMSTRPAASQGTMATDVTMQRPSIEARHGTQPRFDEAQMRPAQLLAPRPQGQRAVPTAWQPGPAQRPGVPRAVPSPVSNQGLSQNPIVRPLAPGAGPMQSTRSSAHSQHRTAPLGEFELPQSDLQCIQHGLHLWSLRSPKRTPSKPCIKRFYQFVTHFAVEPSAFPPRKGLRELKFSLSQVELSKTVQTSRASEASIAPFSSGSLRYRLRLCKQDLAAQQVKPSHWTTCPTFWPQHIFVACNEQHVQPRRRQHFQHDVPIELSDLVRLGDNTIQVSLPEVAANMDSSSTYFMGVEVITTLDYEVVRNLIETNEHISTDETLREIQRRLKPKDSDDIIFEDDRLRATVADPFSSRLFKTPVRGVDCKHIECFDLDIWLQTRSCKPSHDRAEPSLVDCWRCPICDRDARPVSLRIDDFFADVQRQLVQSDGDDIKDISIEFDGRWKCIREADDGENVASNARGQAETTKASGADSATQAVVIVDDD